MFPRETQKCRPRQPNRPSRRFLPRRRRSRPRRQWRPCQPCQPAVSPAAPVMPPELVLPPVSPLPPAPVSPAPPPPLPLGPVSPPVDVVPAAPPVPDSAAGAGLPQPAASISAVKREKPTIPRNRGGRAILGVSPRSWASDPLGQDPHALLDRVRGVRQRTATRHFDRVRSKKAKTSGNTSFTIPPWSAFTSMTARQCSSPATGPNFSPVGMAVPRSLTRPARRRVQRAISLDEILARRHQLGPASLPPSGSLKAPAATCDLDRQGQTVMPPIQSPTSASASWSSTSLASGGMRPSSSVFMRSHVTDSSGWPGVRLVAPSTFWVPLAGTVLQSDVCLKVDVVPKVDGLELSVGPMAEGAVGVKVRSGALGAPWRSWAGRQAGRCRVSPAPPCRAWRERRRTVRRRRTGRSGFAYRAPRKPAPDSSARSRDPATSPRCACGIHCNRAGSGKSSPPRVRRC